jgi:hypothetical protein
MGLEVSCIGRLRRVELSYELALGILLELVEFFYSLILVIYEEVYRYVRYEASHPRLHDLLSKLKSVVYDGQPLLKSAVPDVNEELRLAAPGWRHDDR